MVNMLFSPLAGVLVLNKDKVTGFVPKAFLWEQKLPFFCLACNCFKRTLALRYSPFVGN